MNIRTSVFRGLAVLSLTAFGLTACEDKIELPEPTPDPIEVTVAPTAVTIAVGGTASAAAVVKNSTNQAVTWSCPANNGVATVDANGKITAVAPGSVVCSATAAADANAKGLVSVTVVAPTVTMTLLPQTAQVVVGSNVTLQATLSGTTNQAVTCATSAAGVATVAAGATAGTCVVTAVAPGIAVITATSAANTDVKQAATVTVVPVTSTVQITLQPPTATIAIGQTVQLVPNVTGTDNTAVTYASSAEGVATVSAAGVVTGVSGGVAVITATAAADPSKKQTSVITVSGAPPEPSISIASIIDNDEGTPIDPDSVEGQVDVTVNVSAVPENDVRAVVLYVTGEGLEEDVEVCRQNFANPLGTTQGVATINCPVNTADLDDEGAPLFLNGEYTFVARALTSENEVSAQAEFCPGGDCVVNFLNIDIAGITVRFDNDEDPTSALDQNGLRWNGGDVIVEVRPALFSGEVAAQLTATIDTDCDDEGEETVVVDVADLELVDGVWTYTWEEEDLPGTYPNVCVTVGDGVSEDGDEIVFEEESRTSTFRLDNQAPTAATASLPASRYINDAFTITVTTADAGVDRQTANTIVRIVDANATGTILKEGAAGTLTINAVGLAESATSNAAGSYRVQVVVEDALGNTATYLVGERFGVDRTVPTLDVDATEDSGETNVLPVTFTFAWLDSATPPAGPSGFSANPVTVSLRLYNAQYPNGVCVSTTTFLPVAANLCNQTREAPLTIPNTVAEGYYVLSAFATDAAGNVSTTYSWTTLFDLTNPEVGNLVVPTLVTGGQPFAMSAQVLDNVELGEVWSTVLYNGGSYALVQAESTIGTYGVPLVTAEFNQNHTVTAPYFIRSITTVDAAGRPVVGYANTVTPHFAEFAVLDVAGVELGDVCPALSAAAADSTQNCFIRRQDITAAYQVGNTAVNDSTTKWWAFAGFSFAGAGDATTKFIMDPATDAIDAIITGPAQTFNNPFPGGVYFYAVDESGRAHLLAQGTVGVTDNTITGVRTWSYRAAAAYPEGTTSVFALGLNGTTGDALVTATETVTVLPPPED